MGTWYEFFARRPRRLRRRVGARLRRLPVPERQPRLHDLVPRPRARHDPPERLRGPGRLLPDPRRAAGDTPCSTARTGQPAVLPGPAPRENDKFPPNKPYREIPIAIQDRPSTRTASCSIRTRGRSSTSIEGPYIPDHRRLADLEPRVLREHDHGQRQHLAVPDGRAAPLPAPLPERLPVALPHSRLRQHPRRRGLADRQRGRLPRRTGEHHAGSATSC